MGKNVPNEKFLFSIFIDDVGEGLELNVSRFADDTELGAGRLWEGPGQAGLVQFKTKVLHFSHNSPLQHCRLGTEWLHSDQAGRDLGL